MNDLAPLVRPMPVSRRILFVGEAQLADAAQGCRAFGFGVDVTDEIYGALSDVADDPAGFRAIVIDCASVGGDDAARRHLRWLCRSESGLTVVLVSDEAGGADEGWVIVRRTTVASDLRAAVVRAVMHRQGSGPVGLEQVRG